jgi:hypothetical protein
MVLAAPGSMRRPFCVSVVPGPGSFHLRFPVWAISAFDIAIQASMSGICLSQLAWLFALCCLPIFIYPHSAATLSMGNGP